MERDLSGLLIPSKSPSSFVAYTFTCPRCLCSSVAGWAVAAMYMQSVLVEGVEGRRDAELLETDSRVITNTGPTEFQPFRLPDLWPSLRDALEDSAEQPLYIETLPRRGYRFIAPLEQHHGEQRSSRKAFTSIAVFLPVVLVLALAGRWLVGGLLSSRRMPTLSGADTVVLADFANSTGDAIFDDTLKQAVSVQFSQSPFFNILSDQSVREEMKLMDRSPSERVTQEIAQEVCLRSGSKGVLAGSIARLGSQYVIGLKAVNCQNGAPLVQEQVQAASKEEVLKALGGACTKLRGKLGESVSSIQKFDVPIFDATTPSLEALENLALGKKTEGEKGSAEAIPLFQRAIELDPNFAMAYNFLAGSYSNTGEYKRASENVTRAYELRDRVSEQEKLDITAHYYILVTGDLEKANQALGLFAQIYPHRPFSHLFLTVMGCYIALNRLAEAKAIYQQMQSRKIDAGYLHLLRYQIAFLERDTAEMKRRMAWEEKPVGDFFLSAQSDTEAYFGRLRNARELSEQAVQASRHNDQRESAAEARMDSALREAEFGNTERAREETASALLLGSTRDVQILAALALARAGEPTRARRLADELERRFPMNTMLNGYWLPTIRATIEIERKNPGRALEFLKTASSYELGGVPPLGGSLYPAYVRGHAELLLHRGKQATAEFQKFLEHPGIVLNFPFGALARLGLARAYAMQGDTANSRAAYQDFLTLWKDADPDVPILRAARSEYAKLQ
jgi:pentatricopeptide repeat protein